MNKYKDRSFTCRDKYRLVCHKSEVKPKQAGDGQTAHYFN